MRSVMLDARWIRSGIGSYVIGILRGAAGKPRDFSLQAIVAARGRELVQPFVDRVKVVDIGIYGLREQFRVPWAARGADLLHVPHYNAPVLWKKKLVVTIHDVTHLVLPRRKLERLLYAWPIMKLAARNADHVITGSENAKQELMTMLGIDERKITVIHHGVGSEFQQQDRAVAKRTIAERLELTEGYLLFLGNFRPHKNVGTLVDAYARLRKRGLSLPLVVVGGGKAELQAVLKREDLPDGVICIPSVSADLLPALYAAAELVVVPSLSEGFGLPVVEAMACGAPVACSRATSLPEVAGDAAEFFDPSDSEDMCATIERVLSDAAIRECLRQRGLVRAKRFTWDSSAQKHLDVYRSVLAS